MVIGLLITFGYLLFLWLFFVKFKVMKFSPVWALVSAWFLVHLLLLFIIVPRFYQPATEDARVVRHTIQIVPRLPERTLLKHVWVEPNVPVKAGDRLFGFDQSIYLARVQQAAARLASAKTNVQVLKAQLDAATSSVVEAQADLQFAKVQLKRYTDLAAQGAASAKQQQRWKEQMESRQAAVQVAKANRREAELKYESNIDGVNTAVAEAQAELDEQEYYLKQTTIYAPEDGFITNLQARPGLVVGGYRAGSIASFVCDSGPYILATFFQEHLLYIKEGQDVEIALDSYPGQIFGGKVQAIWAATGQGQFLPSGTLPKFIEPIPRGRFAVQITVDDPAVNLDAGIQGSVAIYTGEATDFEILRRIELRTYSWGNYLYPMPF